MNGTLKNLKVLVVDDDRLYRTLFERYLTSKQVGELKVACSPLEALDIIESGFKADVIVSDIKMPGMDGPEFIRKLRLSGKKIPVIFISGSNTPQLADSLSREFGAELLVKPSDKDDMEAAVLRAFLREE